MQNECSQRSEGSLGENPRMNSRYCDGWEEHARPTMVDEGGPCGGDGD